MWLNTIKSKNKISSFKIDSHDKCQDLCLPLSPHPHFFLLGRLPPSCPLSCPSSGDIRSEIDSVHKSKCFILLFSFEP